jgi:glutathione S-transferase
MTSQADTLSPHLRQALRRLVDLRCRFEGTIRDEFSVADILMTHVLAAGSTDRALLEPYTNVQSYLGRCTERPAWKKTLDAYLNRVEAA